MNIYFAGYAFGPLLQSWTLSTEIAFYVLVPIWAYLVSRRTRGHARRRGCGARSSASRPRRSSSVAWKAFVLSAGLLRRPHRPAQALAPVVARPVRGRDALRGRQRRGARAGLAHSPAPRPAVGAGDLLARSRSPASGSSPPASGSRTRRPAIPLHLLWGQHYLYGLTAALLVLPAVFGPQRRDTSLIRRFLTTRVMVYLGVDLVRHLPVARAVDRPLPVVDRTSRRSPSTRATSRSPGTRRATSASRSSRCCSRCSR